MVRRCAVGVLTALVVGLALGVVARALMRVVAVAAGGPVHFSWGGSAAIVLAIAVAALPGCLLASLRRRRGRSLLLVAGALFLCVPATGVAAEEVAAAALSPWQWAGVLAGGAGVYAAILAMPWLALRVLDAALADPVPREPRARVRVPRPRANARTHVVADPQAEVPARPTGPAGSPS